MRMLSRLKSISTPTISSYLTNHLSRLCNLSDIDKVKLQYGIEVKITSITKLIVVMLFAVVFQISFQVITVLASYNLIREKAFGVHAKTSMQCTILSLLSFVFGTLILEDVSCSNTFILISLIIMFYLLRKYAPMDTDKNPLVGKELRDKLKRETLIRVLILGSLIMICPSDSIKTYLLYGILIAVISVLPITYKIFERGMNNYEKYEQSTI